jgi:hypothetical protein
MIRSLKCYGLIGLLISLSLPTRANNVGPDYLCASNLKQIDGAVQQWYLAQKSGKSASTTLQFNDPEFLGFLKGSTLPICLEGGTYQPGKSAEDEVTCSAHGTIDRIVSARRKIEDRQDLKQSLTPLALGGLGILLIRLLSTLTAGIRNGISVLVPTVYLTVSVVSGPAHIIYAAPSWIHHLPQVVFVLFGIILSSMGFRNAPRWSRVVGSLCLALYGVFGVMLIVCW